jgi:hypothetical protein
MLDLPSPPNETPTLPKPVRYPGQVEILQRAVAGDLQAADLVLSYLSSSIPDLRHLMLTAIHDWHHTRLWLHMLRCLAVHRWSLEPGQSPALDCHRRDDQQASERIDRAIAEAFVVDESLAEQSAKEVVLRLGLASSEAPVRYASACLLGLRGNPDSLPFLERAIDFGDTDWKIYAIASLATMNDERCGPPLVRALAQSNPQVHKAAGRALEELGAVVQPALIQALEHPSSHVRWHAARCLGAIGDVRAIHVLAEGLLDENRQVRWASASALAEIGSPAVPAILDIIRTHPVNEGLRQVLFHALHAMPQASRKELLPLIEALGSPATSSLAPAIASKIIMEVQSSQ